MKFTYIYTRKASGALHFDVGAQYWTVYMCMSARVWTRGGYTVFSYPVCYYEVRQVQHDQKTASSFISSGDIVVW